MENQGSFKLLRSFLGSIAGGLSSLASLPFAKRKTPEGPPVIHSPPLTGLDYDGDNLGKLYPDMELSETRKRARLSLDGVIEEKGKHSIEKQKNVIALGEPSGEGSGETSDVCATPVVFDAVSHGVGGTPDECDVITLDSGVSQGGNMTLHTHEHSDNVTHVGNRTLHTPFRFDTALDGGNDMSDEQMVGGHEEMPHDMGDDSDDNLASFRRTLLANKMKQKKRGQESVKEEELPRKKVRFGNSELGLSSDAQSSLTSSMHGTDTSLKKCTSSTKRKRAAEVEEKTEKKLKALTLSQGPVLSEGKTYTVGIVGVSTRKQERADDKRADMKSKDEKVELQKAVLVQNLPLNDSGKAIRKEFSQFGAIESMQLRTVFFHDEKSKRKPTSSGQSNKTPNSQNAHIVYMDELSAAAALAHNMKEFNGNIVRVTAGGARGTLKEMESAAGDGTWSIFVSNLPVDVKDEELLQLFGSSKLDVKTVRVTRDPSTGRSKGTAYVFFNAEADLNFLLSSRRTWKLRERVLHVSRALNIAQRQQRLTQPRLAKRSTSSEADESSSHGKRAKLSSPHEAITVSKNIEHQGRPIIYTRSKQNASASPEDHAGVNDSVSHVYTTRHVAASVGQSNKFEEPPEAKRKRVENRQRGLSRSKKIRRT